MPVHAVKRIRSASVMQEKKIAKQIGGRRQPGSGSGPWNKGDVVKRGEFRVEAKFTQKKQYTLKLLDLQKVRGQCEVDENLRMEVPVMHLMFTDENLTPKEQWVILPYEYWLRHLRKEEE